MLAPTMPESVSVAVIARRSIVAAIAALCVLAAFPLAAQDEAPLVEPAAAPSPIGPVTIPRVDITARAEELAADLRRIEASSEQEADIGVIEVALTDTVARISALRAVVDTLDPARVSLRVIDDQRVDWHSVTSQLSGWMEEVQLRWEELTLQDSELEKARELWWATGEKAAAEDSPLEIVGRIGTEVTHIDAVTELLRVRREEVAALMDRVATANQACTEALDRLMAIETDARGRLLTRDATPIWEWSAPQVDSFVTDATAARAYWFETLSAYFASRQARFSVVLIGFLAFLLAVHVLKRWSARWPEDDESLADARFVLSRPYSSSIAFAVVLTVFLFEQIVGPVQDLIEFLAVIPILRLGLGLLPGPARSALVWTMGLLVLNRVWSLPPDGSYLRRVLLLLVTFAAIVGVMTIARSWRKLPETQHGMWWVLAWLSLLVMGTFLGISMLANLLGWSNLSQVLTDSFLSSASSALAWMVVALTATALGPLVMRTQLPELLPSIDRRRASLASGSAFLASTAAFLMWSRETLRRFQLLEPLRLWFDATMEASASIGGLEVSVGRTFGALFVLLATWVIGRVARFVLREEILPRTRIPEGSGHSVVSVVNYLIWGSGLLLSAAAAGLNTTQLTVAFGALGVGIGFGLQNIVGNFVSGLILIFERPIKVGDQVETSTHFGIVTGIGIRASTIKKFDGAEVVVPNSDLVAKELVNWTRSDMTRRIEIRVRTTLSSEPRIVLDVLRGVAESHPKTLAAPAPLAFMIGFGESALDFRLLVWVAVKEFLVVSSDLHVAVKEELEKAGIRIPVPERDLRVLSADGDELDGAGVSRVVQSVDD